VVPNLVVQLPVKLGLTVFVNSVDTTRLLSTFNYRYFALNDRDASSRGRVVDCRTRSLVVKLKERRVEDRRRCDCEAKVCRPAKVVA
jgi:hypothetical protein